MSNLQVNFGNQKKSTADEMQSLSAEEVTQLLLGASLSATRPLIGLMKFLINERIVEGDKLKSFLAPMLVTDGFPPATKAMLDPIWKSLLLQLEDFKGRPPV
ncbi:hypothetical protein [Bradyrhizobium sp.]|uniref:hypothetical protein n=1 Tax=Bradyrhizobium sp. TaxID=376 RepID=UPI003C3C5916